MVNLVVVDDEPDFAQFIVSVAESVGYGAVAVTSVTDLRSLLKGMIPSVMVVDLQMPEVDGLELLRELGQSKCPAKIVLMSGVDLRVLEAAGRFGTEMGLSVAGVLPKPVRAAEFKAFLLELRDVNDTPTPQMLDEAITGEELFLNYQPKIDLATRRVVGVESLVRWKNKLGRVVMPDYFIPLAERTNLIDPLTAWVVDKAFAQAGQWRREGLDLKVAVNLSAKNIHDHHLPDILEAKAKGVGVCPEDITLELTETAFMYDPTLLLEILGRMRLKGFKLSIDDFGTGYSSLRQLIRLPFSELKIDKSFVMEMTRVRDSAVVIRTIISMAQSLGLSVVAEGVETEDVSQALVDFGCGTAQGYLFAQPMAPEAIAPFVQGTAS